MVYFHPAALSDLFAVHRLWQRVHVHGSFESGTKFRLQGRFLRRHLICVTAASAKKWIPEKAIWKAKLQPLVSSGKQQNYWLQQCGIASVISNWKCQYLNLILYKTGSNKIPKSASLGTNKPILHCTRRASLLYTTTTKLVTTQSLLFLNAKFTSGRLRLSFPFFHTVYFYRKDIYNSGFLNGTWHLFKATKQKILYRACVAGKPIQAFRDIIIGAFFPPFLSQNLFSLNQTLLKVRGKRAGKPRTLENLIGKQ